MSRRMKPSPRSSKPRERERLATAKFLSRRLTMRFESAPRKKESLQFKLIPPENKNNPARKIRTMMKRPILLTILLGACWWSTVRAQDTSPPAATNAVAATAATNAVPADSTPKPDAAGTATGASADAQDAGGSHFVSTEPTALTEDDKKDPEKVKKYAADKKAFDE